MAHAQWLRRLARTLAADRDDADDLVQNTWVQAIRCPPDAERSPRPWLAEVMRNLRRMSARGASRRHRREQDTVHGASLEMPGTDALLESLELQRRIAALVSELDEPYRTTVLLRFYEERTASAIAAAQGVPAGTVRWRLSEGLRRIRQKLDHDHGGRRAAWAFVAAPTADQIAERIRPVGRPGPTITVGVGLALTLSGVLLWVSLGETPPSPAPEPPLVAAAARSPTGLPSAPRAVPLPTTTKGNEEMRPNRKAAALFGVVLPALVASASDGNRPLGRTEAIEACVRFKERSLACAEQLVDHFVRDVPNEQRAKLRQKALKDLKAEGSGPIEPRRRTCAADVDAKENGRPPFGLFKVAHLTALEACDKEPDCSVRVACWLKVATDAATPPP
jgi:RNA polymerase sigma factor (sigma-70 family)